MKVNEDGVDEDLLPVKFMNPDPEDIPEVDTMDYLGMAQDIVKLMLHKDLPPMDLADSYCEVL